MMGPLLHKDPAPRPRRPRQAGRGFTLIEAALVTVIIGVAVVSMLELLAAGTLSNSEGTELTTAVNLANNVREITRSLKFHDPDNPTAWDTKEGTVDDYDNVMDLDDCEFSPPLDVRRQPIADYANWKQVVRVETVAEDFVASVRPDTTDEPTARVTVTIQRNGVNVYSMSWLVVAPKAKPPPR
jgi:type II secretory pathway pseudopilin PulG